MRPLLSILPSSPWLFISAIGIAILVTEISEDVSKKKAVQDGPTYEDIRADWVRSCMYGVDLSRTTPVNADLVKECAETGFRLYPEIKKNSE